MGIHSQCTQNGLPQNHTWYLTFFLHNRSLRPRNLKMVVKNIIRCAARQNHLLQQLLGDIAGSCPVSTLYVICIICLLLIVIVLFPQSYGRAHSFCICDKVPICNGFRNHDIVYTSDSSIKCKVISWKYDGGEVVHSCTVFLCWMDGGI